MAPVLAVAELPVVEAGGEHRPVERGSRTAARARTASARFTARGAVWIMPTSGCASISCDQAHERLAAHHAVGVEHDHVAVARGPSAGRSRRRCRSCARTRTRAAPVEDAAEAAALAAPVEPGLLLVARQVSGSALSLRARRSRSASSAPGALERAVDRAQARRRRARPAPRRSASRSRCAPPGVDAARAGGLALRVIAKRSRPRSSSAEAEQRRPEADRDPAEERAEEERDRELEPACGPGAAARRP